MNLVEHLISLAVTIVFVVTLRLTFEALHCDLDFLIGWWSCMVWYGMNKYFESKN